MKYLLLAILTAAPAFADELNDPSKASRWAIGFEAIDLNTKTSVPLSGQKTDDTYGISGRYHINDSLVVSLSHFRPTWSFDVQNLSDPLKNKLKITTLMLNKQVKRDQAYAFVGIGYSSIGTTPLSAAIDPVKTANEVSWEAGAGYELTDKVFAEVKWRHFGEVNGEGLDTELTSLGLSLNYRF